MAKTEATKLDVTLNGHALKILKMSLNKKRMPPLRTRNTLLFCRSVVKPDCSLISTANTFLRQQRAGALRLLQQAAAREVNVRVLVPMGNKIKEMQEQQEQKQSTMYNITNSKETETEKPKSFS
jgi:hypothetical protein